MLAVRRDPLAGRVHRHGGGEYDVVRPPPKLPLRRIQPRALAARYFDAMVAILVSVALFLHGVYTLHKNAQQGNRWWQASFWRAAPGPVTGQQLPARNAMTGGGEVAPPRLMETAV